MIWSQEHHGDPDRSGPSRLMPALEVCPACTRDMVHPTWFEDAGEERWHVWLRCGNCEWTSDGVFDRPVLERYERRLDQHDEELAVAREAMVERHMSEEIDLFVAALQSDAILPVDF